LTESVACVADEQTVRDARWLLSENHQLKSRVEELQAQLDKVHAFVNERAQFIQVLRNYVGEDNGDYIRWTGHAEARRVLAETLGIELDKDTGGIRKPVGGPSNGS
jgi:thermostable 8-oxoguanine DNA glycosylase